MIGSVFFSVSKALSSVTGPWFWALLFALAAAVAYRWSKPLALALVATAAALPLLFASPKVAGALQRLAESGARDTSRPGLEYDAVIVLGGSQARIDTAAKAVLQGRARTLLYSGIVGPWDARHVRASLHAAGVADEDVVLESHSRNTRENAVESARIVQERGWRTLLLVTSASHVDRALGCFHDVGLYPDVLPAERLAPRIERMGWMPRKSATAVSRAAVHELLGRITYRVMGYTG
jgi:uncharacterized SAM-binding protein YcdF (DUF218 family)